MIKDLLKITAVYIVGVLIFPYSWLREQPHAIGMAYLDSIGSAHEHVKRYLKKGGDA